MPVNGCIISLPGVPNEMEHILHESIIPYLQKRYDLRHVIKVRVLHCSGLGEGMIDEKIGDLETLANPTVGLAAHTGAGEQDGFALSQELRQLNGYADVPIAFSTRSEIDSALLMEAQFYGGLFLIGKPYEDSQLLAQLSSMVRIKQLQDELKTKTEARQWARKRLGGAD